MKIKKVTYTVEVLICCENGKSAIDLFNSDRIRILDEMKGNDYHETIEVDDLDTRKNRVDYWHDMDFVPYGDNANEMPLGSILRDE